MSKLLPYGRCSAAYANTIMISLRGVDDANVRVFPAKLAVIGELWSQGVPGLGHALHF